MRHKQGMADVPYREILYWQILHFVYPYNVVNLIMRATTTLMENLNYAFG